MRHRARDAAVVVSSVMPPPTHDAGHGTVRGPLAGATIVVTRAASRASSLVAPLEALGAEVLTYAATRIVPRDVPALRRAAAELARYDWVVFTSAVSVMLTCDATEACGVAPSQWAHTQVACIGSSTADALRERGIEATLVPQRFVAEGLLEAFEQQGGLDRMTVLYPAAAGARHELADGMRARGANVDLLTIYESVVTNDDVDTVRAALREGRVDAVTLAASSAVDGWVQAMSPLHDLADVVSIGPITTHAAQAAGLHVATEASPSTIEGLVAAVVRAIEARRDGHQHHPNFT